MRRLDAFQAVAHVLTILFCVICVVPLAIVVSGSLSEERTLLTEGYQLLPQRITFDAYQIVLEGGRVIRAYGVSAIITIGGTGLGLLCTAGLAYAIANPRYRLSRSLAYFVYLPLLFSGGLVPFYILVTQVLHLGNSLWAVILPLAVNPFFVFVAVAYFRTLPSEIIEAARVDGAGELMIYLRVVLPISVPILATVGLFYAIVYWNDWFMALLFISDPNSQPLQLVLRRLVDSADSARDLVRMVGGIPVPGYSLRMAVTVLTVAPILLAYPFVQRFFVRGLTLGAVKG